MQLFFKGQRTQSPKFAFRTVSYTHLDVYKRQIDNGGYEAEDKSEIITKALEFAADYSAKSCMVEGSFGHGVPFKD